MTPHHRERERERWIDAPCKRLQQRREKDRAGTKPEAADRDREESSDGSRPLARKQSSRAARCCRGRQPPLIGAAIGRPPHLSPCVTHSEQKKKPRSFSTTLERTRSSKRPWKYYIVSIDRLPLLLGNYYQGLGGESTPPAGRSTV